MKKAILVWMVVMVLVVGIVSGAEGIYQLENEYDGVNEQVSQTDITQAGETATADGTPTPPAATQEIKETKGAAAEGASGTVITPAEVAVTPVAPMITDEVGQYAAGSVPTQSNGQDVSKNQHASAIGTGSNQVQLVVEIQTNGGTGATDTAYVVTITTSDERNQQMVFNSKEESDLFLADVQNIVIDGGQPYLDGNTLYSVKPGQSVSSPVEPAAPSAPSPTKPRSTSYSQAYAAVQLQNIEGGLPSSYSSAKYNDDTNSYAFYDSQGRVIATYEGNLQQTMTFEYDVNNNVVGLCVSGACDAIEPTSINDIQDALSDIPLTKPGSEAGKKAEEAKDRQKKAKAQTEEAVKAMQGADMTQGMALLFGKMDAYYDYQKMVDGWMNKMPWKETFYSDLICKDKMQLSGGGEIAYTTSDGFAFPAAHIEAQRTQLIDFETAEERDLRWADEAAVAGMPVGSHYDEELGYWVDKDGGSLERYVPTDETNSISPAAVYDVITGRVVDTEVIAPGEDANPPDDGIPDTVGVETETGETAAYLNINYFYKVTYFVKNAKTPAGPDSITYRVELRGDGTRTSKKRVVNEDSSFGRPLTLPLRLTDTKRYTQVCLVFDEGASKLEGLSGDELCRPIVSTTDLPSTTRTSVTTTPPKAPGAPLSNNDFDS